MSENEKITSRDIVEFLAGSGISQEKRKLIGRERKIAGSHVAKLFEELDAKLDAFSNRNK